jgi:hypothetical protein
LVLIWRASGSARKLLWVDFFGVLVGGLIAGGCWLAWLRWGGGWSYFWEDFRVWSEGYYAFAGDTGHNLNRRLIYLFTQFKSWGILHLIGIPLAIQSIIQFVIGKNILKGSESQITFLPQALLGGFYLGWLYQANFIQLQFDYHIAPTILLALALIGGKSLLFVRKPLGAVTFLIFFALASWFHPLMNKNRLACWGRCWYEGSTPEIRDKLNMPLSQSFWVGLGSNEMNGVENKKVVAQWYNLGGHWDLEDVNWTYLEEVAKFFRQTNCTNREITCFGMHTSHLYVMLDLLPSTRLPFLSVVIFMYPNHEELIRDMLAKSPQRYVVTDLMEWGYEYSQVEHPENPLALPADFPEEHAKLFPWSEPVVFRAGPYLVHKVTGPIGNLLVKKTDD